MKRSRQALIRWELSHRIRKVIDEARAECVRQGVEFDEAYAARLMKAVGRCVILDDKSKPGKARRKG